MDFIKGLKGTCEVAGVTMGKSSEETQPEGSAGGAAKKAKGL